MQCISLYMDYKLDESYTPSKIAVRAGTNFHDLTVSNTFLVWLPGPLTALKCKAKKVNQRGLPCPRIQESLAHAHSTVSCHNNH